MKNCLLKAGLGLLLAGTSAPAVLAQETSDESRRLDTVTVTSQKREQNVQDVPIAISVVGGELLEDSFTSDLEEIGQLAPSVTVSQGNNDRNTALSIRGIGTQVFSVSVEPSVSTVIDGVVLTRPGSAFSDLVDIERIEVLRGPQGTLFGKNASAGVINIITKDPSDELEAFAELLVAEYEEVQIKGSVSNAINDTLGYRVSGYYRDRGGHIGNFAGGRGGHIGGEEAYGGRLKLLWEPAPNFDFTLNADYSQSEGDCCQWQIRSSNNQALLNELLPVVPSDENDRVNVDADLYNDSEHWGVSGEANWRLGDHTLTSITAYRYWQNAGNNDVDSVPYPNPLPGRVRFNLNAGISESETFTQEFRLTSPSNQTVEYVAGVFFYDAEIYRRLDRLIQVCLAPGPAPGTCGLPFTQQGYFDTTVNSQNIAAFGQADWHINDRLTAILGLRALEEENDFVLQRYGNISGGPVGPLSDDTSDDNISVKIGAKYDVTDNANVYFTYAQGYKGEAYDSVIDLQENELDQFPIEAETSNAYEAGLKSSFIDGRLIFNLAAFLNQFENFQAQSFNQASARFVLANVGEVETSGIEADFEALLSDQWTVSGGAAWINAEIQKFPNAQCYAGQTAAEGCVNGVQDLAGAELPNAPEFKFNLRSRYETGIGSTGWQGYVQGSYVWQDEVQFALNQNPGTIQEAYGIFDASIGASNPDGTLEVSFFAKNLFDESYAASIFQTPLDAGGISHILPRNYSRYVGGVIRLRY